jgi:hypothetical protein
MTDAVANPLAAVLPANLMPEPQSVTFSEVISRIEAEQTRIQAAGFTTDGTNASDISRIRPALEGLLASENSITVRGSRLDQPTKTVPGLTEGNGIPQAFGKDDTGKALEKLENSMTNMTDVATYLIRMQIVNKSVQGFQRVLDQLGRGQ